MNPGSQPASTLRLAPTDLESGTQAPSPPGARPISMDLISRLAHTTQDPRMPQHQACSRAPVSRHAPVDQVPGPPQNQVGPHDLWFLLDSYGCRLQANISFRLAPTAPVSRPAPLDLTMKMLKRQRSYNFIVKNCCSFVRILWCLPMFNNSTGAENKHQRKQVLFISFHMKSGLSLFIQLQFIEELLYASHFTRAEIPCEHNEIHFLGMSVWFWC